MTEELQQDSLEVEAARRLREGYCPRLGDIGALADDAKIPRKQMGEYVSPTRPRFPTLANLAKLARAGVDLDHYVTGQPRRDGYEWQREQDIALMVGEGWGTQEQVERWMLPVETEQANHLRLVRERMQLSRDIEAAGEKLSSPVPQTTLGTVAVTYIGRLLDICTEAVRRGDGLAAEAASRIIEYVMAPIRRPRVGQRERRASG
jgi:hypothetical protein